MDQATFDTLQRTLTGEGPDAAIERLIATLRERKDYASLFYALLLQKRHALGVPLVPLTSSDLPPDAHEAYENAIRDAGRLVGNLYLEQGDIPRAWPYFRMLNELGPIAQALEKFQPGEDDDSQQVIEIAFHHGVHPKRGFDMLLERFGICNAITTMSGELPFSDDIRRHCIGQLVRALHEQLRERLVSDITQREGTAPATSDLRELIAGRDWLFDDDFYHIDVSHLQSVVQMSADLLPGPELDLARQLSAYGERLSPRYQSGGEPPFENSYKDYSIFLAVLAGDRVDEGIAHFQSKVEAANPEEDGPYAAEVLVNLLLRVDRPRQALEIARRHLADFRDRRLSCPSIQELCQRVQDYETLAAVARENGDAVNFVAGLISAQKR
jgi:hypothetical protein